MHAHAPEANLQRLLASLSPVLHEGAYVFCHVRVLPTDVVPIALFREAEGISLVLPLVQAQALHLPYDGVFAWITLEVYSSLFAVGMTAAVAHALAEVGICANVVSAFHHDHVFVPYTRGDEAVGVLKRLAEPVATQS
ncbi:MAG: ACT domain-containing protein [Bacteroidia bacterium]|nr:ACT domain-containing protein [Bacteroidia bacterium]